MDLWDSLKYLGNIVGMALIGLIAYFGKTQLSRIEILERKQAEQDKSIAILESEMKNIREDIKEIKDGINKLIDKLL